MVSIAFFPLRSNASSLIAGSAIAAVRRRLVLASLLHDEVWLDTGRLQVAAGPTGTVSFWMPIPPGETPKWQSPRRRASAVGSEFHLGVRLDDAPPDAPFTPLVASAASVAWDASFEPFKRELPRGSGSWDWLKWGHADDPQEAAEFVRDWTRHARDDPGLQRRWPEPFVRGLFVDAVHKDLALSATLRAGIDIDRAHLPVVAARIRAGDAAAVLGHRALHLVLPKEVRWEDVNELRRHKAIAEYRSVLRDVESVALAGATSLAALDLRIREELWGRIAGAEAKRPSRWIRRGITAIGVVAGEAFGSATTGVPAVGGLAGSAAADFATDLVEQAVENRARPRWLALHARVRQTSQTSGST